MATPNRGDKEFIFNLYLKKRPEILNKTLDLDLDQILLEKYYEVGSKIDIYAMDRILGREVLIETTLGQSNGYHQDKLLKMLASVNEGTIGYLAVNFQNKHVKELKDYVMHLGKPVQLYLVHINLQILPELTDLDRQNSLLIFEHLYWLDNVQNVLKVLDHVEHPYFRDLRPKNIKPISAPDLKTREGINQQLLLELRRQIPEYLVFHREKHQLDLCILNFGGGMAGIGYFLSAGDRYGKAFLELRFDQDKEDWYKHFERFQDYFRKEIGNELEFHRSSRTIGYYFDPTPDPHVTIAQIVKVFRDFLELFTFYVELGRALISKEKIGV